MVVTNMSTDEVYARLLKIHENLTKIQEMADKVMNHLFLDNAIKCVFLCWYEKRLKDLEHEVSLYSDEIIDNDAEVALVD